MVSTHIRNSDLLYLRPWKIHRAKLSQTLRFSPVPIVIPYHLSCCWLRFQVTLSRCCLWSQSRPVNFDIQTYTHSHTSIRNCVTRKIIFKKEYLWKNFPTFHYLKQYVNQWHWKFLSLTLIIVETEATAASNDKFCGN